MVQRKFILGEEWLYYKLYCGARTADTILVDVLYPLTQTLKEDSYISEWFFIRYSDPDPHLRVRFKLSNEMHTAHVISKVKDAVKPYLEEQLIWTLQTDTYIRELERYGTSTMEASETIFYADSELVVKAMKIIEEEELYFLFVLKCITSFVSQFGMTLEGELQFYQNNAKAFKDEFGVEKITKHSLDKKYRDLRAKLQRFLEHTDDEFNPLWKVLKEHKNSIFKPVKTILQHKENNHLAVSFESLLGSHIHMLVNRAFRSKQRFYELVAYDFLERYKTSQIKRVVNIKKTL